MATFFSIKQAAAMDAVPDTILPVQFFFNANTGLTGEQRLMLAVLTHALSDLGTFYASELSSGRRLFSEAYEWFLPDEQRWIFSFENICDCLGFDARSIRAKVKEQYGQSYAPPVPSRVINRYPIPQQNYTLTGVTCVRESEKDPMRRYDHSGLLVRLFSGKVIKVPHSTIRGPWLRVGETGDLTISLHFAIQKGIALDAPKRIRVRYLGEMPPRATEFISA